MVIILTVSFMQAAQHLAHFLPEVPLLTCPKLTFAFFTIYFYSCHSQSVTRRFIFIFLFHCFFQLLSSHFWFVIISLPQPRSLILTLLTIHFFLCDSPDATYFQQLKELNSSKIWGTAFPLTSCSSCTLCRRVQNNYIFDYDKGGTSCV